MKCVLRAVLPPSFLVIFELQGIYPLTWKERSPSQLQLLDLESSVLHSMEKTQRVNTNFMMALVISMWFGSGLQL